MDDDPRSPPRPRMQDDTAPSPESSADGYVVKKPRIWPLFAALLAIAGGVTLAILYFTGKRPPLKVLVMLEYEGGYAWNGSKPAAELSDEVCDLLTKVGFDVVKIGDPAVDKVLAKEKAPEDAAKSLGASFVVYGNVAPQLVDEKLPKRAVAASYVEARVDGTITVRHLSDPNGQASTASIAAWSGALEKEQALALLKQSVVDQIFEAAASRLMSHPTIVEILKGSDVAAMTQIGLAREYMELRKARIDVATRAYDTLLSELRATAPGSARKITFHTPPDEEDTLVGTGPDGLLVRVEKATRTISPRFANVEFLENLETLGWQPIGGGAEGRQKPLWRGYHVYGRPAIGQDGTLVIVEDMFTFAKAIAKNTPDGWKRVRVDPQNRYAGLRVSPKGDFLAAWITCKGCAGHLAIIDLATGDSLIERSEDETNYGFTWLDDKRLAFIIKPERSNAISFDGPPGTPPGEEPREKRTDDIELRTFNLKTHEEVTIGRYAKTDGFASPVASPNGKLIAVQHAAFERGENVLALIDTTTGELTDVPRAASGAWPAFSPDGSLVVYTEHDDLRLLKVKDRSVESLTENPMLEQNPIFSADGKSIFFEVLDKDPVASRRHVQLVASIEVAP